MNTIKTKNILSISLFTLSLLFYGLIFHVNAYPGYHGHGHSSETMTTWLSEELGLDEAQKDQLNNYVEALNKKMKEVYEAKVTLNQTITAYIKGEAGVDEDKLNDAVAAHTEKLTALTSLHATQVRELNDSLTEEQKSKYDELMSNFGSGHCYHKT